MIRISWFYKALIIIQVVIIIAEPAYWLVGLITITLTYFFGRMEYEEAILIQLLKIKEERDENDRRKAIKTGKVLRK